MNVLKSSVTKLEYAQKGFSKPCVLFAECSAGIPGTCHNEKVVCLLKRPATHDMVGKVRTSPYGGKWQTVGRGEAKWRNLEIDALRVVL